MSLLILNHWQNAYVYIYIELLNIFRGISATISNSIFGKIEILDQFGIKMKLAAPVISVQQNPTSNMVYILLVHH